MIQRFNKLFANNRNKIYIENDETNHEQSFGSIHSIFIKQQTPLTQLPFSMALNHDENLPEYVISSTSKPLQKRFFRTQPISGMYAFCLVKTMDQHQYLLLKTLDHQYESNHSALGMLLRTNKFGKELNNATIICGGEAVFIAGKLVSWNLKSGAYSQHTDFDENNADNFIKNLEHLWLPSAKYQSINSITRDYYQSFFKRDGSLKKSEINALQQYYQKTIKPVSSFDSLSTLSMSSLSCK